MPLACGPAGSGGKLVLVMSVQSRLPRSDDPPLSIDVDALNEEGRPCPVTISTQRTQAYRSWVGRKEVGTDRPWPGTVPGCQPGSSQSFEEGWWA